MTCVSIGLLVNKKPVVGVIYAPCFNELYVAVSGKGSYLNGKRLQVSAAKAIKEAIIVCVATDIVFSVSQTSIISSHHHSIIGE